MNADRFETETRTDTGTSLWVGLGVAACVAAVAWAVLRKSSSPMRRHGDCGLERRDPRHFLLAGNYPRRRRIDLSGAHPLFERRASVYDAYDGAYDGACDARSESHPANQGKVACRWPAQQPAGVAASTLPTVQTVARQGAAIL